MEFKGRTRGRQRQRGTCREVRDPKHNMHVLAQLKVTDMDLSVIADYKVSGPRSHRRLLYKGRVMTAVNTDAAS